MSIRWMKNEYVKANMINCYQKRILYVHNFLLGNIQQIQHTQGISFFNVSALLKLDKKFIMLT